MGDIPTETCDSNPTSTSVMAYGCDLTRVFTYEGSEKDSFINYVTLLITLITLVLCTRRAGEAASRYSRCAAWFWVPFTLVLFAMQIFADCSTNNVGISAVWSAYVGFIFLGWWRMRHLHDSGEKALRRSPGLNDDGAPTTTANPTQSCSPSSLLLLSTSYAIPASLAVWTGVCVYYAIVEGAITTVAHLVAFGVGAAALLLFETLHRIPRHGGGASGDDAAGSTPYGEVRDDD